MTSSHDLLIVGAGHLGRRIASQWNAANPDAYILAETRTDSSHSLLRETGATPGIIRQSTEKFPNVVFCVPPSAAIDYPEEARQATQRLTENGRFIFTSSGSAHGAVEVVTETTPRSTAGRAERLFNTENVALELSQGCVIRLSGLYTLDRGPHTFWLSRGAVSSHPDGPINLIHYDDAAAAVVALLQVTELPERRNFLACAKHSSTRFEIMQDMLRHPKFEGGSMPTFANDAPLQIKAYNNEWTREVLKWKPKWDSFGEFMEMHAATYKQTPGPSQH